MERVSPVATMDKTVADVLLVPGVLTLIGVIVYAIVFWIGVRDHALPKYRWAGLAILVVAFLVAAKTFSLLFDSLSAFYRLTLPDRKVLAAHYVVPILPLGAIAILFGAEAWFKRFDRSIS